MNPQYVLLLPQSAISTALDLAHAFRARMAAALFACGVDVFAPNDPLSRAAADPRTAIGGTQGRALCRDVLRSSPTAFVTLELVGATDHWSGTLELLDGHDLEPRARTAFEGDADAFTDFFERSLCAILGDLDIELPVGWPELLGHDDARAAVAELEREGAQLRRTGTRPQPRGGTAFPN